MRLTTELKMTQYHFTPTMAFWDALLSGHVLPFHQNVVRGFYKLRHSYKPRVNLLLAVVPTSLSMTFSPFVALRHYAHCQIACTLLVYYVVL